MCAQQGELLREISELCKEVNDTKLAQDNQIKAMRDEIAHDTKAQVVQSIGYAIPRCVTPALTGFLMFGAQGADQICHRGRHRLPGERRDGKVEQKTRCEGLRCGT